MRIVIGWLASAIVLTGTGCSPGGATNEAEPTIPSGETSAASTTTASGLSSPSESTPEAPSITDASSLRRAAVDAGLQCPEAYQEMVFNGADSAERCGYIQFLFFDDRRQLRQAVNLYRGFGRNVVLRSDDWLIFANTPQLRRIQPELGGEIV